MIVAFDRNYHVCSLNDVTSPPITPVKKKSSLSDAPTFYVKPCAPQCEDLNVPTISIIPPTPSPTNNIPSSPVDINFTSPHLTKNKDFSQTKQLSNTVQPLHVDSEVSVSVSSSTEQLANTSQRPRDSGISVGSFFPTEQHLNTSQHLCPDSGISVNGSSSTEQHLNTSQCQGNDSGISVVGSFSTKPPSIVSKKTCDDFGISANSSFSTELPSIAYKHVRDDIEIFTSEYIIITG